MVQDAVNAGLLTMTSDEPANVYWLHPTDALDRFMGATQEPPNFKTVRLKRVLNRAGLIASVADVERIIAESHNLLRSSQPEALPLDALFESILPRLVPEHGSLPKWRRVLADALQSLSFRDPAGKPITEIGPSVVSTVDDPELAIGNYLQAAAQRVSSLGEPSTPEEIRVALS